ncbi:heavy metal translocating P-type ATPase [Lipingzhangella sp. LS1_29]|uniref:Heavy metal translocating P-type ATPase n=1 Tax=Lipingzhangella rawalii TaxID=2055835 RepID=A0ABU2HAL1_9ACTN|nr:heavy metal translocating P-type ATPase [Lipingzhangella rawalii]MDS1272362.1 heavy metal translocating P-type ATPase [Lipingzhangella rawalii]
MTTRLLFWLCLAGLGVGGGAWLADAPRATALAWLITTALASVPALWWVVDGLRQRRLGTDAIAVLALLGTAAVQEYLAGAIVAVMLTGGRLLEQRAEGRARRDLSALLSRVPKVAHRLEHGKIVTVDASEIRPGDLLLVRSGEVVPVDGRIEDSQQYAPRDRRTDDDGAAWPSAGSRVGAGQHGDARSRSSNAVAALLDESAVTGEPLPVEHGAGDSVPSGVVNAGEPFPMRATTDAETSTYAGIVRLAREAHAHSAPLVRMADRYAALFLPLTLLLAGAAWLVANDPVRAVAVLVVATPCPLILAAPIAFTSGLSRSARRGVIIKGGGALERLARARVLLFDKTGTVTAGRPRLNRVVTGREPGTEEEVLRLAASLDQVSAHVLATPIVRAAERAGLRLALPTSVTETPGQGMRGNVDGRAVAVGKATWVSSGTPPAWVDEVRRRAVATGSLTVFVGVDGHVAGVLLLDDPLRPEAPRTFRLLRRAGITRTVMITGDRQVVADAIADVVGADEVHAEQSPDDKVAVVRRESDRAATVMVGDGINDAPALASAGVGVALGARGATASSEAADIVITVDRLERLAETLAIARRSRTIATQSVLAGMGMSLAAMLVAAAGMLPPTAGALLQEGIDVAVILNALRALGPGLGGGAPRLRGDVAELVRRLDHEHQHLWPGIRRLPRIATAVAGTSAPLPPELLDEIEDFARTLTAHEHDDERLLYPEVAKALGGADPTGTMSRAHAEITSLLRRIRDLTTHLRSDAADIASRQELSQVLLELHAILKLHFVQEEEAFHSLAEET